MKRKSILGVLLAALAVGTGFTSCQDMMLQESDRYAYTNANDTLYSYWGIERCLQNIAERQVILNEVRGDLVKGTAYTSDSINNIANFNNPQDGDCCFLSIKDYYAVINNCNAYLANADTTAEKSNRKYMMAEYKQVMGIRAWTYLQLVNLYGEVPYITEPITSLDVVKNFSGDVLNKDNIIQKLINDTRLIRFSDLYIDEYPSYGDYNNGSTRINSKLLYFPVDLVIADICLTGGAYDYASVFYLQFLTERSSHAHLTNYDLSTFSNGSSGTVSYSMSAYMNMFKTYTSAFVGSEEILTLIPSAANRRFGTMLTKHYNLMGWTSSSFINTSTDTNEDDNTTTTTDAGAISISKDEKTMQMTPSDGFYKRSNAQTLILYNEISGLAREVAGGDARKNGDNSTTYNVINSYSPSNSTESYRFINKFTSGNSPSYSIPIYRKGQVWLRLAEALNRLGLSEYAFAILKDGLADDNLPTLSTGIIRVDTTFAADGVTVERLDTIMGPVAIPPKAASGGAYYIGVSALQAAESYGFFPLGSFFDGATGIHGRGCGNTEGKRDTIFTYDKVLAAYKAAGHSLSTKNDTIDAIEDCIADEMALELSFEGYRFTDLVRIANHKNDAGGNVNGTQWLADKIARRNDDGSAGYQFTTDYQTLYNKLTNPANWYLAKPASYK